MPSAAFALKALVFSSALIGGGTAIRAEEEPAAARGRYLVEGPAACGNCHTQRGPDLYSRSDIKFSGGQRLDIPPGTAYPKNITPDIDTGIGSWTKEQIIHAIREGATKEGNVIGPPMPISWYAKVSDEDVAAIAEYIMSVPAIKNAVPESRYRIALKPYPKVFSVPSPNQSDRLAYGEYLVSVSHCLECHTPMAGPERDYQHRRGAGGFEFQLGGKIVRSRNLTSDPETGIGNWTDEQVKRAITEGVDKNGRKMIPQMPYAFFKNLKPEDVDAIVSFIRTLAPVRNEVPENPSYEAYLK